MPKLKSGKYVHRLSDTVIANHSADLQKIYNKIYFTLKIMSDDFDGIQFIEQFDCIAIHLYNRQLYHDIGTPLTTEIYPKLALDFSNAESIITESIKLWEENNEQDYINYLIESFRWQEEYDRYLESDACWMDDDDDYFDL